MFIIELYDSIEKMSQSVRHHVVEGIRNMWAQLNELARAHTTTGTVRDSEDTESKYTTIDREIFVVCLFQIFSQKLKFNTMNN